MSSTRVLLSFKNSSDEEIELLEFLDKKGQVIGRGNYLKMLLLEKMNEEKKSDK